ncbi:hypothetical protein AVEN_210274-1 [Araneus ventricosus]|uniref:Uncharacterized protein n=1 Tax=Araneus ventricosus TaxID=182803 RepID=A0A4Y2JUC7_ARAVE|nr:hypothetical protein AVEN_210274-1 [Araneus ventricosus]
MARSMPLRLTHFYGLNLDNELQNVFHNELHLETDTSHQIEDNAANSSFSHFTPGQQFPEVPFLSLKVSVKIIKEESENKAREENDLELLEANGPRSFVIWLAKGKQLICLRQRSAASLPFS